MKKSLVKRTASAFVTLCILFASLGAGSVLAESAGTMNDLAVFYGKVTGVDGNRVTVAIAAVNMPDGFIGSGNAGPGQNEDNQQGGREPRNTPPADLGDRQGAMQREGMGNIADNLVLTGESVTVTITDDITVTKQVKWRAPSEPDEAAGTGTAGGSQSPGNNPGDPQRQQNGIPKDGVGQGPGFMGEEAALSDINVDSIVILTYQSSTQALLSVHILGTFQASSN